MLLAWHCPIGQGHLAWQCAAKPPIGLFFHRSIYKYMLKKNVGNVVKRSQFVYTRELRYAKVIYYYYYYY